jgi:hypothetical protein
MKDENTRGSGHGLVRIDALKARYKRAKKETGLEETLAAELASQGWEVTRQVWCRPMNEGWRRIDLYAVGHVLIPRGCGVVHARGGIVAASLVVCVHISVFAWWREARHGPR